MRKYLTKQQRVCSLLAVLLLYSISLSACRGIPAKDTQKHETTLFAMDTVMELTAYGEGGEEALTKAQQEIQRLDQLLSSENASSETARLNGGETVALSEDTKYLLDTAKTVYEKTNGLFDLSIYPLMELWGFPTKGYRIPEAAEKKAALALVDGSLLTYDPSTGDMTLPYGMKIDFGGIGKGYASQRVVDLMKEEGITSAMVSLGGNVQVLGTKPDGSLWKIGIQDPLAKENAIAAVVEVKDIAVITSGGYHRYFEDEATGERYCHILDPFTGDPAESDLASATVLCADGTLGDALSTSLFLMGKEEAIRFWRSGVFTFQMVLIDKSGTIYATDGLKNYFSSDKAVEWIE